MVAAVAAAPLSLSLSGKFAVSGFETFVAVAAGVILVAIVLATFVASLFGMDLVIFDAYKTASPRQYRNLKWVCRLNGPLIALGSVVGLISTPVVAFDPSGGMLLATGGFVGFSMFLWLSVRWFFWSLRA